MIKPVKINILGIEYSITYTDKPSEVDIFGRESCWGQVDYWTRTIRIYDNKRSEVDLWQTIFHEVIHVIAERLKIDGLNVHKDDDKAEKATELLSIGLTDTLFRNGLFIENAPE